MPARFPSWNGIPDVFKYLPNFYYQVSLSFVKQYFTKLKYIKTSYSPRGNLAVYLRGPVLP